MSSETLFSMTLIIIDVHAHRKTLLVIKSGVNLPVTSLEKNSLSFSHCDIIYKKLLTI